MSLASDWEQYGQVPAEADVIGWWDLDDTAIFQLSDGSYASDSAAFGVEDVSHVGPPPPSVPGFQPGAPVNWRAALHSTLS